MNGGGGNNGDKVGSTLSGGSGRRGSGEEGRQVESEGGSGGKETRDEGNTMRNTGE
jgi:hypothetical protein